MATRLTPADAWQGFVGDQSLAEFMHLSLAAGHDTPEAAVAAYLDESYDDLTRDIQDPISREELETLLVEYLHEHWRVDDVAEYRTTYTRDGRCYEALQLPWDVVTAVLDRHHDGSGEDDALLVNVLLQSVAPEWVRDAEGWVDEHGWGLIGPEVAGAGEDD